MEICDVGSWKQIYRCPALIPDYVKPGRSIYETDDLIARPLSVTEHTTTHLQMEPDTEIITLPKK